MLKKVFESLPMAYSPYDPCLPFGIVYYPEDPMPDERVQSLGSFWCQVTGDVDNFKTLSYFAIDLTKRHMWPSYETVMTRYEMDGTLFAGGLILRPMPPEPCTWQHLSLPGRLELSDTLGSIINLTGGSTRSARSKLYIIGGFGASELNGWVLGFSAGGPSVALVSTESNLVYSGETYSVFDFEDLVAWYSPLTIDEDLDRLCLAGIRTISVYKWSTGEFLYEVDVPGPISDMCLEENGRMFVAIGQGGGMILLFDYMRAEVMGVNRIARVAGSWNTGSGLGSIRLAWDFLRKMLMIREFTADDGNNSTLVVSGYRMVPSPVRITEPLPLKVPRQRRLVPVLVSVLDGLNRTVTSYPPTMTVTGSGTAIGAPKMIGGNAIMQVATEGHPYYGGDSGDVLVGSPDADPPNCGAFDVVATVVVPAPAIPALE